MACHLKQETHNMKKDFTQIIKSDRHTITQFMTVINRIGYTPSVVRFIEKELYKEYNQNYSPSICKKCNRERYKVSLQSMRTHPPSKPRLCVECNPHDNLDVFTPKMSWVQAWTV